MKTVNTILLLFLTSLLFAQVGTNGEDRNEEGRPVIEYNLTLEQKEMTLGGVTANGMTINGSIPGPTLEFNEGDLAIINVTNKMDKETSVHWHGLILPNFYDGVPYKPIGYVLVSFPYNVAGAEGSLWFHSHSSKRKDIGI